jgi:hypothetical protein
MTPLTNLVLIVSPYLSFSINFNTAFVTCLFRGLNKLSLHIIRANYKWKLYLIKAKINENIVMINTDFHSSFTHILLPFCFSKLFNCSWHFVLNQKSWKKNLRVNLCALQGLAVPAPLVTTVLLLLSDSNIIVNIKYGIHYNIFIYFNESQCLLLLYIIISLS